MDLKVWLQRCPLVAILRGVQSAEAESICAALEEAGICIVEVPLNSPDPFRTISILAHGFGNSMLIGAGTLTAPSEVAELADAGGRLAVTPHADIAIVRAAKSAGLIAVPGFFNPTEAFALLQAGADAIKLFPAEVLGPPMLKAMRAVLPKEAMVIPVGGIGPGQIAPWAGAGADGFGVGTSIFRPGDDAKAVGVKAKALVTAIQASRNA